MPYLSARIDGNEACASWQRLMQQMLPSIRSIAADACVFRQDSAPAHCARQTVELIQCETPKFIAPDSWPPNSPDLNPVESNMRCYAGLCLSDASLKRTDLMQRLTDTWNGLSQSIFDDAVEKWWKRLRACVKEKKNISNIGCNNWTWTRLVEQLNLLCFRLCNNRTNVLSLHVSVCTWLISQGSVATVSIWGG